MKLKQLMENVFKPVDDKELSKERMVDAQIDYDIKQAKEYDDWSWIEECLRIGFKGYENMTEEQLRQWTRELYKFKGSN